MAAFPNKIEKFIGRLRTFSNQVITLLRFTRGHSLVTHDLIVLIVACSRAYKYAVCDFFTHKNKKTY